MKKDIKDYLHLYIGCLFISDYPTNPQNPERLTGNLRDRIINCTDEYLRNNPKYIKLILRPLSSMTEEECDQFGIYYSEGKYVRECFEADATYGSTFKVYSVASLSERLNEMRRSGIDCDNLIPDGLAINAETLK